jgi:YD repeat-containing protein
MTYDERNRLQSVRDNDYSLDYEYDELGNRRHVHGVFSRRLLDSNGVPIVNPNGNQTQDDWKREKMPEGF